MAVPVLLGAGAFALAFAAAAGARHRRHEDQPARRSRPVPRRRGLDVDLDRTARRRPERAADGLPVPDGPVLRRRPRASACPDWVVQRLWLGTLLALAAWGVGAAARRAARTPARGRAPVAGAVILLNPFVVTYANRTTVTLLAYAALPWLLLAVHRGLRRAPPLAMAGGLRAAGRRLRGRDQRRRDGVDAARARRCCSCYEIAFTRIGWRQARGFVWRTLLTTVLHVVVVDRPRVRAVLLRDRLPALHRAAGHDLGHDERDRERCA